MTYGCQSIHAVFVPHAGCLQQVRLVPEIDTPGHGAAWCAGMPELCPSPPKCLQPLDVSNNKTFETIEAVL